jgi:large subunit ribosomal protein L24
MRKKKNKGAQRKAKEKHVPGKRGAAAMRPLKMKVKRGDTVKVIAGKDKGKTGEVLKSLPREHKVVIDGVHLSKRHLRSTGRGQSGRIVERPMPIHVSNVALVSGKKAKKEKKTDA